MTPRPAATLVLIRPGDDAFEVLMLERPGGGVFGGLWVFPGGAVEPIDHGELAERAVPVPPQADDLPWRAAALRETVEEVGIAVTDPQVADPIDAVGEAVFRAVLERSAVMDGLRLRLMSRWVTPRGLPTRFDARFYLAVADATPAPVPRPHEVVDVAWVTPGTALSRAEKGIWAMVTPTLHHLRWLTHFNDVAAVRAAAERSEPIRVEPLTESDGSEVRIRLPGMAEQP